MRLSNYDKFPFVPVSGRSTDVARGWDCIADTLLQAATGWRVLVVEAYPGADLAPLVRVLRHKISDLTVVDAASCLKPSGEIARLTAADVTDDPVFGRLTQLQMLDFFDPGRLHQTRRQLEGVARAVVVGSGAALIHPGDILVYADLARWEIQTRMRRGQFANLGLDNRGEKWSLQYKRGYFVDWRVADRHKQALFDRIDFLLDTNAPDDPKLITGACFRGALKHAATRPFRVVPFFDPAPWGGQWMKDVCDLDGSVQNYGWCFDCVPEENSLLLGFGDVRVEVPSIDLVFARARELLGEAVYQRFGAEFPIRFDFLDTMDGGNLSLQVHPLTDYIRRHFGMSYTQDESYYLLDAAPDATVYLGLRENIDREEMCRQLFEAAAGRRSTFEAERFVNRFPAARHDHFLIPAGTVHCSGANSMVLEISATPYIFTF
ncbi:MAG: class I mannose-6-phosphate isomerase [Phycisphaerales bacterium]|nr:class I mannose-6-phosphate isomerase [Phycisphaerales bacterium]